MANKSPTYKSGFHEYEIEGSNPKLSLPAWLVNHRGEDIDKAVTAARNALVAADLGRNKEDANGNAVINPNKAFKVLGIIPTEIRNNDETLNHLENKFNFSFIDDRFIDQRYHTHEEAYFSDKMRSSNEVNDYLKSYLRYQSDDAIEGAEDINTLVDIYRKENPTLSTLWGTIAESRWLLQSDPYNILTDEDGDRETKSKVLLLSPASADNRPIYGKISDEHLANVLDNIVVRAIDTINGEDVDDNNLNYFSTTLLLDEDLELRAADFEYNISAIKNICALQPNAANIYEFTLKSLLPGAEIDATNHTDICKIEKISEDHYEGDVKLIFDFNPSSLGFAFDLDEVKTITFMRGTHISSDLLYLILLTVGLNKFDGEVGTPELRYEMNPDNVSYSVAGLTKSVANVEIPALHNGYPVTAISNRAFEGYTGLISINIPNSVISIGDRAFYNCYNLTSITVDADNTSYKSVDGNLYTKDGKTLIQYAIGKTATIFTIPSGVETIGDYAFSHCSSLTSIEIPNGVMSIGSSAFHYCTSLMSVSIGNSVTSIGYDAFGYCSGLTGITIPDGVTSIGDSAFIYAGLSEVSIPNSVESIGAMAFFDCNRLTDVYYSGSEDEWNNISIYADNDPLLNATIHFNWGKEFYTEGLAYTLADDGASYIVSGIGTATDTAIVIPSTYNDKPVSTISYDAFANNSKLTSVTIPNSIEIIGSSAFYGCYKLAEVINKSSLTITKGSEDYGRVGYYALEVHNGESKIDNKAGYIFYNCDEVNYLVNYIGTDTELTLPANYNGENYVINEFAFYGNSDITSIDISDGVSKIYDQILQSCWHLSSIKIGKNIKYLSVDSFYINASNPITDISFKGTKDRWTTLSSAVNFSSFGITASEVPCQGVREDPSEGLVFELNEDDNTTYSLVGIGSCTDSEIIIPNEYNGGIVSRISSDVFKDNRAITRVELPENLTEINDNAFNGCLNLIRIILPETLEAIGSDAFKNCHKLLEVKNYSSLPISRLSEDNGYVGYYAKRVFDSSQFTTYIYNVNNYIMYISTDNNCYLIHYAGKDAEFNLSDFTWNQFIRSQSTEYDYLIYKYAMYGRDIETINIRHEICDIGEYAFAQCKNLNDITLDDGLIYYYWGPPDDYNYDSLDVKNVQISSTAFLETAYYNNSDNWSNNALYLIDSQGKNRIMLALDHDNINDDYQLDSDVVIIAQELFKNCEKLTTIDLKNCRIIGSEAFSNCANLRFVYDMTGISYIGDYAFYSCYNLMYMYLPQSLFPEYTTSTGKLRYSTNNIGNNAFENCFKLAVVDYGLSNNNDKTNDAIENLRVWGGNDKHGYVEKYALNVNYPKKTNTIYDRSSSIYTIDESGYVFFTKVSGNNSTAYLINYIGEEPEIILPQSFNNNNYVVNSYALYKNNYIETLQIPISVKALGDYSCYDCESLTTVMYEGTEALWEDVTTGTDWIDPSVNIIYLNGELTPSEGLMYTLLDDGTYEVTKGDCQSSDVVVASTYEGKYVTSIGENAFKNTSIKTISLPATIKHIKPYAFYGCSNLECDIKLPSVETIGDSAFYGAFSTDEDSKDSSITIGNKLESIGIWAFNKIRNIYGNGCNSITIQSEPPTITCGGRDIENSNMGGNASIDIFERFDTYYASYYVTVYVPEHLVQAYKDASEIEIIHNDSTTKAYIWNPEKINAIEA